jgi:glycosyltransferase involved in cell wall biosynthesis
MNIKLRVALLIPCYNAENYLPELFIGVMAQTVSFTEVICYDDGSTDRTAAVAESLGAKVIRGEKNHGAAYARNRLLESTTCDWVHFHDADDLIDPNFVEVMSFKAIECQSSILCNMRVLDRESREFLGNVSYEELKKTNDYIEYFLINTGFAIVGLYPLKDLKCIGGFREDLRGNEDPDLHTRLAIAGYSFQVEEKTLVTNLVHKRSFSASNWNKCMIDRLSCYKHYAQIIDRKYSSIISKEFLSLAWILYSRGFYDESKVAIKLAKFYGAKELDSHQWITRFLSRLIGFEAIFRIKVLFQ